MMDASFLNRMLASLREAVRGADYDPRRDEELINKAIRAAGAAYRIPSARYERGESFSPTDLKKAILAAGEESEVHAPCRVLFPGDLRTGEIFLVLQTDDFRMHRFKIDLDDAMLVIETLQKQLHHRLLTTAGAKGWLSLEALRRAAEAAINSAHEGTIRPPKPSDITP